MISGGGVAVCLLLSAHRAVIFAIAQLSWHTKVLVYSDSGLLSLLVPVFFIKLEFYKTVSPVT